MLGKFLGRKTRKCHFAATLGRVFLYLFRWLIVYFIDSAMKYHAHVTTVACIDTHTEQEKVGACARKLCSKVTAEIPSCFGYDYSTMELLHRTERFELNRTVSNAPSLSPVTRMHQCGHHYGDVHPQAAAKTLSGERTWRQRRDATRLQTRGSHWRPREQRRACVPICICEFACREEACPGELPVLCGLYNTIQNIDNCTHQVGLRSGGRSGSFASNERPTTTVCHLRIPSPSKRGDPTKPTLMLTQV